MLKILFFGDINGRIGREALAKVLPGLKKEYSPDFIIANAENAAHGSGVTENVLKELVELDIDCFTTGDHAFDNAKQMEKCYDGHFPIIRPANFPPSVPGVGYKILEKKGQKICVINLLGRVFMPMSYDCPLRALDDILAGENLANLKPSAIIVDIHAEATAEKITFGHYADGRVSAILGTHTHVQTADQKITTAGTAYLTDVGMVGAADECIGVDKKDIIKTMLNQIRTPHVLPEKGRAIVNGVCLIVNSKTGKATSIKPFTKYIEIK